ncbi:MAG: hypothetical protein LBD11_07180 [Candidatus Peribacteria bacterium]|jgi:hypothetical protein|nr:hypothetical protein [Candidatus Peribacteria bacterium]
MDKEVGDIVKSMTLTPKDRNPRTGQPNKNGLAKLTVAKELETAYKIARNEQEVSANAFDLAA